MTQLNSDHLITIIDPDPEPTPQPEFQKGEGWYQIGVRICPDLNTGKMELIEKEIPIYAKTLLAAKQAASRWAKPLLPHNMPIEGKWEEQSSTNRYGKYWKKPGKYFSCNPELYLIPNQIVE